MSNVITEAKKKLARRCLEELLDKKDPDIYKDLAFAATAIAKGMMMNWLDSKGVHHCAECTSTDQLLMLRGAYHCQAHAHKIASKNEVPLEIAS